jgi:cellulose synthase/poly-beta-1,6-N-acetylglucosamine synthase-like glycosyltransferase
MDHPELVDHVDYLAVHLLPYWEGVHVDQAVDYAIEQYQKLRAAYPDKPVVIAEIGWPSEGRVRGGSVPSAANQAVFLRRFLTRAESEGLVYYLMEAFDQPWKRGTEGSVGPYWGVFDAYRLAKFEFFGPLVPLPGWQSLAGWSLLAGLLVYLLLVRDGRDLRIRGRGFLGAAAFATASGCAWILEETVHPYMGMTDLVTSTVLVLAMVGVVLVLLAEVHEWAEAMWIRGRRRLLTEPGSPGGARPFVSVHVPAYNEPPDMLIETLNGLASLDYENYEVLVVDNNTRDPAVWRPVEQHCRNLGPRFRFFHVSPLAGFKAGALNFALRHTDPRAEVVAVIDSDYLVDPHWLSDLTPAFERQGLAVVQAPQDYRDASDNSFKALCYAEYKGFFQIGMVTRNDRNAIIQHGTMTMVRRRVLESVGGWGEWCITEDAELGLRVLRAGYEALYTSRSYGRGLMPDNFTDFKKQRFRWAYGSVQIMRRHLAALFGSRGGLTSGQRYHFVAGWLPWLSDGMNLLFNVAALGWSVGMVLAPERFAPPLLAFAVMPLTLFVVKLLKLLHLYRRRVGTGFMDTLAAALGGLSLSHTIGRAVLSGLVTRDKPFFRTPKRADGPVLGQALAAVREEALLFLGLSLAASQVVMAQGADNPNVAAWSLMLSMQALPYLSSVLVSLQAAMPELRVRHGGVGEWVAGSRWLHKLRAQAQAA